jgi:chromosome segregation protein
MFKLQKLELTGFKSFADYTEIIFNGDGITAIVGPNGCGKSNISDAITWVLGEQRIKNLRGGEMQDVIFAGTKTRRPSGMAEVVLHLVRVETADDVANANQIEDIDERLADFDENAVEIEEFHSNTIQNQKSETQNGNGFHAAETKTLTRRKWKSRRAALEFAPGEAVSVTRRLYRSGESDYLLNGRICRLRDIQDLFAGTGLSGGHYALIQQEKISQILSAKPSERRQLIEEAAGITKFRVRQRAAEIRLEAARNNLRRVSDIVSEVEKQVVSLRRQAAKTRRYKELQETFRKLSARVFATKGRELIAALAELRDKLSAAVESENHLSETLRQQTLATQTATQAARAAEENLANVRQKSAENAVRRERIERDLTHQTQQEKDLEERIAALRQEIKTLRERLQAVSADAQRLREKNDISGALSKTEAADLQRFEENYRQKINQVRETESRIEKIRQELFRHSTAVERFGEIVRQQTNALEKLAERAAGLKFEGKRAAETRREKQAGLIESESKIALLRNHLSDFQRQKTVALAAADAARADLRETEKNLGKLRDEANALRARRETLAKLDNQNALLAPAVQRLLSSAEKIGIKPRGTLADFLCVEARFEKAVEVVLGANLQAILVETADEAVKIGEWLKVNKSGGLSVLVCNFYNAKTQEYEAGNKEKIIDLLGVDDNIKAKLAPIFDLDFRVLENLASAERFADENCVTFDGDLVYKNRLFKFGGASEKGKILSFKREMRELAAREAELQNELSAAQTAFEVKREKLAADESAVLEIQTRITLTERELMSAEVARESVNLEIERAARHQKVVEDEQKRLSEEQIEIENKRSKAESDGERAKHEQKATEQTLQETLLELRSLRQTAESTNHNLSKRRADFAAAQERHRSLQNALRRIEAEQNELKNRLNNREPEETSATAKLAEIRKSLTQLRLQNAEIEAEKETEITAVAAALSDLKLAREAADKTAANLTKVNAEAAAARNARANLEVLQAEISTKLENLRQACQHELNLDLLNLINTQTTKIDLPSEVRQVEDLREKLDNFGAVNLLALDELSETEERFLFLTNQRKDIVDSIKAATDALEEIKRVSRERFESAFAEINRNFAKLFSEIFGGGSGAMSLLDAADVLESGIEIVAQPPGKRLQNLLLLSGGEKALTAIALVLAIFRFRPAPFCLLDEVDAPLDEANVGRFVEKITEMSENTQFIVITHNKRTMEAARALYGVTMQEAGISKTVSVKFE